MLLTIQYEDCLPSIMYRFVRQTFLNDVDNELVDKINNINIFEVSQVFLSSWLSENIRGFIIWMDIPNLSRDSLASFRLPFLVQTFCD